LPTALVTTSANGLCPGGNATIASGLSAGNFTATCITAPSTILTPPSNAVTLIQNNTVNTPFPSGVGANSTTNLDDNFFSGIPVGFAFNYFGSLVTSVFIGTNGTINLGSTGSTQYNFAGPPSGFPSTANPASTIAVSARDLRWDSGSGTIKYWTEGIFPNRRFVVQFVNGKPYSYTTGNQTAEVIMYETLGTVDIRVFEATNGIGTAAGTSTSKYIGLQDPTKTIGATAPNCTTNATSYWNGQLATIEASAPQAWRFSPPSNYTTVWTANGSQIATGTNIFQQTVTPVAGTVTTYDIRYTNLTTGCQNAPGSAQVVMSVLGNTAPTGVTASYTIGTTTNTGTICNGDTINLATSYPTTVGSYDGLVYQWQISYNGTTWTDIAGATYDAITNPTAPQTALLTYTPTAASQFRCKFVACSGVPSYSTPVSVDFTYHITASAGDTLCGTGTLSLTATGDANANNVKWYADATTNTVLFSGSPFVTPAISATATYYVGVKVGTCTSLRVPVDATIIPAPTLTLSQTALSLCVGVPSSPVTITAGSASYDNYVWSPTTGITGSAASGWIFNPAVTTTYTLTASQTGGQLCATTITVPVTVNVTPVDPFCTGLTSEVVNVPLVPSVLPTTM
jgi:hypothetical protein